MERFKFYDASVESAGRGGQLDQDWRGGFSYLEGYDITRLLLIRFSIFIMALYHDSYRFSPWQSMLR